MNDKSAATSRGVGFTGLLTIVFIVLKLTNVIDWSWVWILAPLWIGLFLAIAVVVTVVVFIAIKGRGGAK
jgi:hypothetical protein